MQERLSQAKRSGTFKISGITRGKFNWCRSGKIGKRKLGNTKQRVQVRIAWKMAFIALDIIKIV